jgi:hypothetical protein
MARAKKRRAPALSRDEIRALVYILKRTKECSNRALDSSVREEVTDVPGRIYEQLCRCAKAIHANGPKCSKRRRA